jgi:hypothetical protein
LQHSGLQKEAKHAGLEEEYQQEADATQKAVEAASEVQQGVLQEAPSESLLEMSSKAEVPSVVLQEQQTESAQVPLQQ